MTVPPRTRRLLLALAVAFAVAAMVRWGPSWPGATVIENPKGQSPRPLGATAYRQLLGREAGGRIDPADLVRRARAVSAELKGMLVERARRLDPTTTDWHQVFAHLREDAPATDEEVLVAYREESARALAFCRAHDLVPLPAAEPRVFAIDNPSLRRLFPLAMNRGDGTLGITLRPPPVDGAPASPQAAELYRRNHCRVCIPPIAIHETYPGHHVAFLFPRVATSAAAGGQWPFFHEGWAQYGEVLLWQEGYWQGDPAAEMGALQLMLLRATRAEVDAGLHGGGLSLDDARRTFVERLLMDEDAAASEVAGHLQSPGKKASYLVGALQLLALRDALGHPRGAALRRFHERFLACSGTIPSIARAEFGIDLPALPARGLLSPTPAASEIR